MKIVLDNISVKFNNEPLFSDLNLTLKEGNLNCLLGRSGSGKTTILKLIAGILQPDKGRIYFNDNEVTNLRTQQRNVGWVPQQQLIFPGLNVRENIAYGLKARKFSKKELSTRVSDTSTLVGLDHLLDRNPQGLSGGERQRVALARALAPEPDILLLDEPFSSLDAPERDRLSLAFRQVQLETGVSTIHVTHAPREAELLSDQVFILSNGIILQSGTIAEIQNQPKEPEVAKLLNIPNFIEVNKELGIEHPVIIPEDAISISSDGPYSVKILSVTSQKIYLEVGGDILETLSMNDYSGEIIPGNKIQIDLAVNEFLHISN